MTMPISRRRFVQGAAAVGIAAFGIGERAFAQTPPSRIRKSALQLPPGDPIFQDYIRAVEAMHGLPQTDPRNWWRQARIHADLCQHYTPEFLPWHRHYLNQFEAICGSLISKPNFALPYWDWSYGIGQIPDALYSVDMPTPIVSHLDVTYWNDPGVYSSPNWPNIDTIGIRALKKSMGVQNDPQNGGAFTSQNIHSILQETDFSIFTNRLETSPHNSGHVVVGIPPAGQMGHMGSGLSPLDPIFWLHHCNVDRLWAQWQLAGNTSPQFPGNYNGQFVDASGQPVDLTAAGAIDFSALGYSYDQFPSPANVLNLAGLASATGQRALLESFDSVQHIDNGPVTIGTLTANAQVTLVVPTTIPVPVSNLATQFRSTRTTIDPNLPSLATLQASGGIERSMLSQFGRTKKVPRRILARLTNVTADFTRPPIVNTFVNCPYLSPQTPWTDAHYAGTFAFFGPAHGHDHGSGPNFVIDLTNALRNIDVDNAQQLKVQFVARGSSQDAHPSFRVGKIDILSY